MKRILSIGLSLALLWGIAAYAASYESDLGFRIDLPTGWTIVSQEGVKQKPDIVAAVFEAADKDKALIYMPQILYNKLKEKITGGEVQYFYKTDSPNFSISVYQHEGTIPASPDSAQEMCKSLPEELSKLSKNPPVAVYDCRLVTVGATPALYMVADAYEQGQKYVQYVIQRGPKTMLLFTATSSKGQDFDKMKSYLDQIMKSFQPM